MQKLNNYVELNNTLKEICGINDASLVSLAIKISQIDLNQILILKEQRVLFIQHISSQQLGRLRGFLVISKYATKSNRTFDLITILDNNTMLPDANYIAVDLNSFSDQPKINKQLYIVSGQATQKINYVHQDDAEEVLNEVFTYMRTIKPRM